MINWRLGSFRHSRSAMPFDIGPVPCPGSLPIGRNLFFASPSAFRRGLGGIFMGIDICRRRFWVGLLPKRLGNLQGVDFQILPPGHFIAGLMQLPMMTAAERDGELVADFETKRSGLGKTQVMRIGRLPAADEAGLRGHKPQMGFVAQPLGLGDGEKALIDLRRDEAG
jgi:hypothetical protein